MQESQTGKCPKCVSDDVSDTGSRIGSAQDFKKDGQLPEPNIPIYKCNQCGETFIIIK